ncbi:hypothetical protein [Actimicrobium sp. CCI2.3]|uniref:hypothetical protein n=1 Tax=Actimicrobium sp. CCI2.3 TaxID=3048616 RepID=UPI002AB41626|nr:hypothetical protein [Actimicrobium sp. CCI2.3]MDY7572716.1 hypothetical protein [Actimicrobium sp. CCI2.3]MEB0022235.1 hypothetical protein [Actimicrobium sp. CCI2.3]
MKPSDKTRSVVSFIATATLALLCFSAGTALIANWMMDGEGLPIDIAAPLE